MSSTKPLLEPEFLARLQRLEIVSKKIFVGKTKGERLTKRKGQSVEFADFRPYSIGDDLHYLDWNLFARLDRLFLRLFLEEEDLHVYILVDNSQSMEFGDPSKLHYAKQVATALGFIGLTNMDRVVIEAFNDRITQSTARCEAGKSLAADQFSRRHRTSGTERSDSCTKDIQFEVERQRRGDHFERLHGQRGLRGRIALSDCPEFRFVLRPDLVAGRN